MMFLQVNLLVVMFAQVIFLVLATFVQVKPSVLVMFVQENLFVTVMSIQVDIFVEVRFIKVNQPVIVIFIINLFVQNIFVSLIHQYQLNRYHRYLLYQRYNRYFTEQHLLLSNLNTYIVFFFFMVSSFTNGLHIFAILSIIAINFPKSNAHRNLFQNIYL